MLDIALYKQFGNKKHPVEIRFEYRLPEGKILALFGASGAGKTTVIRMLAGLTLPDSGYINAFDETWYNKARSIHLKPQQRSIGVVFQDYGLFPNMTVRNNIRFGLPQNASDHLVEEFLNTMNLQAHADQKPSTLSGGQKQRTALARAMICQPRLLLLDEPLSALDHALRRHLQSELLHLREAYGTTIVLVTHDREEVCRIADEVAVLDRGKLVRSGVTAEVFGMKVAAAGTAALKGEILSVDGKGMMCILVGYQLLELPVPSHQPDLKPGDIISLKVQP